MGRKKRKVEVEEEPAESQAAQEEAPPQAAPPAAAHDPPQAAPPAAAQDAASANNHTSSGYAMTSHSGEIIQEDIYVSDGSESTDEEDETEVVLVGSRMGIMRRGLHHMASLQQPNRQWTRKSADTKSDGATDIGLSQEALTEEEKRQREEEELAKLDPAQRAARLLQEKQRREEEAKIEARNKENEENASREPALFSKRTAFDIRFDQIEDKPWERNLAPGQVASAEMTSDFFNYGLSEEDWLEYAQQQLQIRQELIDANRQKRAPDPAIVPIQPRKDDDSKTVTAARTPQADADNMDSSEEDTSGSIGPAMVEKKEEEPEGKEEMIAPEKKQAEDVPVGIGGAWGAGAAPGSMLARLMEEQENGGGGSSIISPRRESDAASSSHPPPVDQGHYGHSEGDTTTRSIKEENSYYGDQESARQGRGHWRGEEQYPQEDYYGGDRRGGWPQHPPPPPQEQYYPPQLPPPPPPQGGGYYGNGRGGYRGRGGYQGRGGGRGGRGGYQRDGGEYYQDMHSGWKRPRDGGDPRRRR